MNNTITRQGTVGGYFLIIRTTIKTPIEVEIIPLEIINRKSATSKNVAICLMLIITSRQPNAAITNLNLTIVSSVICFYLNPPLISILEGAFLSVSIFGREPTIKFRIPPTENIMVIPSIPQSMCCFPPLPSPPPCKSIMNWNKPHIKSNIAAENSSVMRGLIIAVTKFASTTLIAIAA